MTANIDPASPTLRPVHHHLRRAAALGGLTVRIIFGRPDSMGRLTARGYVARLVADNELYATPVCDTQTEAVEQWVELHGHLLDTLPAHAA
jgi:hypothetical protein